MSPEPSRSELLHRIAELEARLAGYETGQTESAFALEVAERKRAEQSSRESEERLRLFLENIPAAIAMFDRDMRYLAVSGRWAEHFGGAERLLGKPHYEIFPDCPERWMAGHRRGMAGEVVRVEDDPWQFPDGSEGWARYEVRPWRTSDGEIGGIIILTEDITERKRAEEALRRSERIYRAIGESIDFGVWVCAPDGRCTYASDSLLKLVGLTLEQFSNFGWANILHPDDADRTVAAWKECVRTQGKWDIEHRCRGVDGDWHPVLARGVPVRDEDGQIACWAGIALDISALKQTEESLRASEATARAAAAELQAIMDAATAIIVIAHDVEARHVGGNRKANELVHQPLHSNLARAAAVERPGNFRLMRDGVELPEGESPLAKVASSGQALRNYELQVVFEDGARIDLLGNVEPLLDDNGRPRGAVAVFGDITERKRAEAALRESEERFRTIADTLPAMIWMAGPDNLCTFVNRPWLEFKGRTMEQELRSGWADGMHPEDLDRCLVACSSSFNARRSYQIQYRIRSADGEYRWVLDTAKPLYREGEFAGYIGCCIDVTEQKRIEEQLRSNHVQLMDSQRLANVGSWELDMVTGRTRWSDEWYRIFGLSRDVPSEFDTFLRCVHPKDREVVLGSENEARLSDSPFGVDFRIIRPDGEVRFIRSIVEGIKNENRELVRMAGAAQDVTEQVKATELLRESEARLKNAERMTHVGNWIWDIKANRVSWSEEVFRIMGQPQDYRPGHEMIAPGDRKRVEQWVSDCLAEKKGNVIEFRIVRPSGDVRTVVLTTEVLQDEDGSPERMFGTCQDVTDARRIQEESFARQKLESLGTLASGIAHDFNNLLGAIVAQTELAMAELEPESVADEELKMIRDVAIRGAEIVRQLMIYAGEESDVPGPVDASKAVQGMAGLLKVVVSRHVALVTDLGEDFPAVRASAAQLSQIVMNLAVNASDALGDRHGVIHVSTRHIAIGRAEAIAKALPAGDYVQLEVSDTGRGMSPETQAKIFDPFFSTKFSGRGLGLAVVDGIVRSLHGAIQVASEAGRGTTFQVLLPCVEPRAHPDDDRVLGVEESTPPTRRATVLVVEDEEPLRLAVAKMLRKWGLEVVEAASGSAAIELLRARVGEIDLILLDLTIPGASSQEVLTEAALGHPRVKVVLTSAYSEEVAKPMMLAPLVCGFIRKPFTIADLAQQLRSALLL